MGKDNRQKLIYDGKTQPVFDYRECIFEKVYVETDLDTDNDGKLDLIAVYIRRPKETQQDLKVPAIYVANPYMMGCNEDWYIPHNVDKDLTIYNEENRSFEEVRFCKEKDSDKPEAASRVSAGFAQTSITEEIPLDCITDWYSYFNSRGYASVFCAGLGTKGSEGFVNCGSTEETAAFAAVIDWLNGRKRAFTNKEDNIEIKADWCTGKVAMSGKSYLGTMCIAVASTGVEGLRTIIPEAAISNWYDYYRYNGLIVPPLGWQGDDLDLLAKYCYSRRTDGENETTEAFLRHAEELLQKEDRESGNYSRFWDERNYLNSVADFKASVFIVHGINDWNVKTNQCFKLWNALEEAPVIKKMLLHQGEHIYIHDLESGNFNEIMHRWLDYWLYEIENGAIERIPNVLFQSNLEQNHWLESESWPLKSNGEHVFDLTSGCELAAFTDNIDATLFREKENLKDWLDDLVLGEDREEDYRIRYTDKPLEVSKRLNGTISVSFEAATDKPAAILSVMLVDYGKENRLTPDQEVAAEGSLVWGKNTPRADSKRFVREETPSEYKVISRGWLNTQNRRNLWSKEAITVNQYYRYEIDMVPTDYIIKEGHRIGLILYGTDLEVTQRPFEKTKVKIKRETIDLNIPICEM